MKYDKSYDNNLYEISIYHYVEELIFNFQKYSRNNLDDENLSEKEYIILMRIRYLKQVTQQDLAKQYNLTEGYVANLLRKMEENNLIQRKENPDNRRQKIVSLTEEGVRYTDNLNDLMLNWESKIVSQISDEENTQLRNILNKLTRISD